MYTSSFVVFRIHDLANNRARSNMEKITNLAPEYQLEIANIKNNQDTISSLQLVEEINFFRSKQDNQSELLHKNLLAIIKEEFDEEINELKIQLVSYKDKKGENRPMFNLTINQAKQVLVRESKIKNNK
jgi:hypothetical protein